MKVSQETIKLVCEFYLIEQWAERDRGGSTFHPRDVGWTHRRPNTKPMRCHLDSAKGSRRGSAICMNFISFARQARKAGHAANVYTYISEDRAVAVKIRERVFRLRDLENPDDDRLARLGKEINLKAEILRNQE